MKETLRLEPYQKEGVAFLTRSYHTFLGDDRGLGKTVQAIAAINRLKANRCLIICPASVKYHWRKELARFSERNLSVFIVEGQKSKIPKGFQVYIINYDIVHHHYRSLINMRFAVGICDEAHRLKNPESLRAQHIICPEGIIHNCVFKMMLTGTPIQNKPIDLFVFISSLWPELLGEYNTYRKFAFRYCNAYRSPFGRGQKLAFGNPSKQDIEDMRKIVEKFMLRRLKKDVLKELPSHRLQLIPVTPNTKLKRLIAEEKKAREELAAKEACGDVNSEYAKLAVRSRSWAAIGQAKTPFCIDYIKEELATCQKVVVFAYHHSVLDLLEKGLAKYKVLRIDGSTNARRRQDIVEQFQKEKEVRVLVGQIQAAGEGLNGLQNVCANAVFAQISDTPSHVEQAIDRLVRFGQEEAVLASFLLVEGSVEYSMFEAVQKKATLNKKILD